jgi:zinc protease
MPIDRRYVGFMIKLLTLTVLGLLLLAKTAIAVSLPHETYTLPNGLRLIVIEDRRAPVVLHAVAYLVGGADEENGKTGLAHFFEHLMFKGTPRFPQKDLNALFDENGMERNAFTMQDATVYYARASVALLGPLMDMEADRMVNLTLTSDVLETERKVVQEERRSNIDSNPYGPAFERLEAELFRVHPYGRPVVGRPEDVAALTLADAQAFYRRHYTPDNAIVVVVGDVKAEDVHALAEIYYGKLKAAGTKDEALRPMESIWTATRRIEHSDARISSPFVIRRYVVPARDVAGETQSAAFEVLADILGGSSQSRLRKALVNGSHAAMYVSASYNGMQKTYGGFGLAASTAPGFDIGKLETDMIAILEELARSGPTAAEVERAKNTVASEFIYGLDNPANIGMMMSLALATDVPLSAITAQEETFAKVTARDVQAAAQLLVSTHNAVTLTIKPQKP